MMRYQAERLRGELSVHVESGITQKRGAAVIQLIGEVNALCLNVRELLAALLIRGAGRLRVAAVRMLHSSRTPAADESREGRV